MGIARFGQRMRRHAVHRTITTFKDAEEYDSKAVIDGPGLAHHIYYQFCKDARTNTLGTENSATRPPGEVSYADYAQGVIRWLDTIENFGFQIEAVFFDGALPEYKKATRRQRLQAYADRVAVYKHSLGERDPQIAGNITNANLPPPPFLVFCVVEELLRSRHARATHVVPGEADPYCVAAAELCAQVSDALPVTIFSDDSDLLVFGVPQGTRIVTFRDVVMHAESGPNTGLKFEEYRPDEIVAGLPAGMTDLVQPAYIMSQDEHCELGKACHRAAASKLNEQQKFADFTAQFTLNNELTLLRSLKSSVMDSLNTQDSRICEVICQLQSIVVSKKGESVDMFLPFLVADPTRASPWSVSMDIRHLAYGVLLHSVPRECKLHEYSNRASRLATMEVIRGAPAELTLQLERFASHIGSLRAWAVDDQTLTDDGMWRYLIAQNIVQHCAEHAASPPAHSSLVDVLTNRPPGTWTAFHLAAQHQAAYYSIRMLKQAVSYATSTRNPSIDAAYHAALKAACQTLATLPTIVAFFRVLMPLPEVRTLWARHVREVLQAARSSLDETQSRKSKSNKRVKLSSADTSKKSVDRSDTGPAKNNPFAMLENDSTGD